MELNLLFLPLLGGYIFYKCFNLTAHAAMRASGEHLLFAAAGCGLIFLLVARAIVLATPVIGRDTDLWSERALHSVPVFLAFLIGALIPRLTNKRLRALVSQLKGQSRRTKAFRDETPMRRRVRSLRGRRTILQALAAVSVAFLAACIGVGLIRAPTTWVASTMTAVLIVAAGIVIATRSPRQSQRGLVIRVCVFGILAACAFAFVTDKLNPVQEFWAAFSSFDASGAESGKTNDPQSIVKTEGDQTNDHMGTAFLACLLGAALWIPLNLLVSDAAALAWLHQSGKTDALDAFLHNSAETKALVQLSLSDGKFYIGNIKRLPPNPTGSNSWVRVLPMVSGYRDDTTKTLNFTTFYQDVYDELSQMAGFSDEWLRDFEKLVPVASIASANLFDPTMYVRFAKERARAESSEGKSEGRTGTND